MTHLSMPLSYYFMGYLLSFCFTVGIRFSYRLLRSWVNRGKEMEHAKEGKEERVMIVGAGVAFLDKMHKFQEECGATCN